jgi:CheY-like chemotaxis protein
MESHLRILIVEDNYSDVEIEKRLLRKEGITFDDRVVETKDDFITELAEFKPDLILCDYSMPSFDGMRALLLRKELAPLTPFILVTGSMNEEVAVECMKAGADDYVLKQNLIRLVPAIKATLEKREVLRLRHEA